MEVRPPDAETVFCSLGSSSGSFWRGEPLSRSGLYVMLKALAKKAGVTGRFNPHSFRHGFAHHALTHGAQMGVVAAILGHRDIAITHKFYGGMVGDDLVELHEAISPLAALADKLQKGGENEE
jgi:site-specific recombinase XerD